VIATLLLDGVERRVDLSAGTSLAIPIDRNGQHPRFFVDQGVRFETLAAGGFTGRVSAGGSCNAEVITTIPHCHGTHTESVGHITADAQAVQDELETGLLPAALVSVQAQERNADGQDGSPLIAAESLDWPEAARALIVRTLPNSPDKMHRDYASSPPYPLLSMAAIEKLVAAGIEHLLIDTPSLDAADDGGRLLRHRRFWGMAPGDTVAVDKRRHCTITEMIFVPDALADGLYLLGLGVGAMRSDAAASVPVVYPVT
jgi:arylformamidase